MPQQPVWGFWIKFSIPVPCQGSFQMRSPLERRAILRWWAEIWGVGRHLVWLARPYLQSPVNGLMQGASFAKHWTIPTSRWRKQSWGPGRSLSSDRSTGWGRGNWIWMISILLFPCPQPRVFWSASKLQGQLTPVGARPREPEREPRESWGLAKATGLLGGAAGNGIQFCLLRQSFCWVVLEFIQRDHSTHDRTADLSTGWWII